MSSRQTANFTTGWQVLADPVSGDVRRRPSRHARADGPGPRRRRDGPLEERGRLWHGFRLSQAARQRGFLTPSGRAEFGLAPLPDDTDPGLGRLMLATIRSHDQLGELMAVKD